MSVMSLPSPVSGSAGDEVTRDPTLGGTSDCVEETNELVRLAKRNLQIWATEGVGLCKRMVMEGAWWKGWGICKQQGEKMNIPCVQQIRSSDAAPLNNRLEL